MIFRRIGRAILAHVLPAALLAAVVAASFLNIKVISPGLCERTTRTAEAANEAYWADGVAHIYTLEAKVMFDGKTFAATSELICAPKSFTRPPTVEDRRIYNRGTTWSRLWVNTWGFVADPLAVHVPDSSRVTFPFRREACQALERASHERSLPFTTQGHAGSLEIHEAALPAGHCGVSVATGPVGIGSNSVFPVTAVSMREGNLRDVLSRKQFGGAGDR